MPTEMVTLVPSRRRPELLKNFIQSVVDTETTTDGLVIIDKKDYADNELAYLEIAKLFPGGWKYKVTEPEVVTMADKLKRVWGDLDDYRAVNLLNDDHYIITKGWDQKLLAGIKGWNFITCNDNWMSPRKAAGATVWSKDLLDRVGWPIYPPGMTHLFIDDLWEAIGRATGCWEIDHSVTIEHRHPLKKESPVDDTFVKTYGSGPDLTKGELWQRDQQVYADILRDDLADIVDKVRGMAGLIPIKRSM